MIPTKTLALFLGAVPAVLILMDGLQSYGMGLTPKPTGSGAYARGGSSCGGCHTRNPGGPTVTVMPDARVLSPGQQISITVASAGTPSGNNGGFVGQVTGGTLSAGTGSKVVMSGAAITHSHKSTARRNWKFGYKASATTTGPVEFYTVAMNSNGSGTGGDTWAFHGSDSKNNFSTPVRLYVNTAGVQVIGTGCTDGNGNIGVYGAPQPPTVGNSSFKLEAVGLPPAARLMFVLGMNKNYKSFDLGHMGAPGCFLHSDMLLQLFAQSTGSNTTKDRQLASGTFTLPAPIPNDVTLKGLYFRTAIGVVDQDSKRPFPVIFTNGLAMTVR
jgi:hypothetical protein